MVDRLVTVDSATLLLPEAVREANVLAGPAGPAGPGVDPQVLADLSDDVAGVTAALADKVDDTDPRLTDARTPLGHKHPPTDVVGLAAALADKADRSWALQQLDGRPPEIPATSATSWPDRATYVAAHWPGYAGRVTWSAKALGAITTVIVPPTMVSGDDVIRWYEP